MTVKNTNEGIEERQYEDLQEKVDRAIEVLQNEEKRLVFASVVKEADITNIMVYKNPEIRAYILESIKTAKEVEKINKRINRVREKLKNRNGKVSYVAMLRGCGFSSADMQKYPFIKSKIRDAVIMEAGNFYNIKK